MNFLCLLAQQQPVQVPGGRPLWVTGAVAFVMMVLLLVMMALLGMRRYMTGRKSAADDFAPPTPRSDDAAAFATASMQAALTRLREQEKELERLHRIERDRAQQSERLSEAVTRNMPTGLLLIGSAGLVTYANPAAEAVLGIQTLRYRRYSEALGEASPLSIRIASCLREGATFRREEFTHTTPAGEQRQVGATISPVVEQQTSPVRVTGAVCLLTDLTELNALQQQVRLKESLAALGELSAGIAHEFKNALATIAAYAQLVQTDAVGIEQRENAAKIVEATRNLTSVVQEFLKFARPFDIVQGEVNLRMVVERLLEDMRAAHPQVEFSSAGEFASVQGDATLLRQALQNLVQNAAEAAIQQAKESDQPPRVKVAGETESRAGQPWQRIVVQDSGAGIAPADHARLFLPFYTTKVGGTGLGLAIVQKIAVHHGGAVSGRNYAAGAEFILTLPMRQAGIQAVDSPPSGI